MEKKMKPIFDLARQFEITVVEASHDGAKIPECEIYSTVGKKGCVLIMSNPFIDFGKYKRQEASDEDAKMMKHLWGEVGCELFDIGKIEEEKTKATDSTRIELRTKIAAKNPDKIYKNVTAEEMKELLMSLSETSKGDKYAYIVVVISTHGAMVTEKWLKEVEEDSAPPRSGSAAAANYKAYKDYSAKYSETARNNIAVEPMAAVFFGEDWGRVRERDIIELFYNDKSFKLRGIPKFFILNYCRSDIGLTEEPTPSRQIQALGSGRSPAVELQIGLPLMSDMVIAYATHRFHAAFNQHCGSWLITAIKEIFSQHYQYTDVLNMLTMVNKEVKVKSVNTNARSIFESSLVKRFYLCSNEKDVTGTAGAAGSN